MNPDVSIVFIILRAAETLFRTNLFRSDLVAMLVLLSLLLS